MKTSKQALRPRKTRTQTREETRRRLVQAGWEVFATQGFTGASVEEIAAQAGFTRGAFYSNFADKEALFLAIMDERLATRVQAVTAIVKGSSPLTLLGELRSWSATVADDSDWLPMMTEFRAHALRNETVRQRLVERERSLRVAYGRGISAQFDALGIKPPVPIEQMAVVVQALDNMLPVECALDPNIPEGALFDALELLFRAVVALSQNTTP
jgi:AcrR family transcriptional regulator